MATSNQYLYYYGDRILNNARFQIGPSSGTENQSPNDIQIVELARGSGGRVVSSRRSPKQITISSSILPGFSNQNMEDAVKDYKQIFLTEDRYFRIVPEFTPLFTGTEIVGGQFATSGNIASFASYDGEWEYSDLTNINAARGSARFNINTTAADGTIRLNILTGNTDLSGYTDKTSNLEILLFIPDVSILTRIDFKIGQYNPIGGFFDYFEGSTTTNYEGQPLKNGWNLLSTNFIYTRFNESTGFDETIRNQENGTVDLSTMTTLELTLKTNQTKTVNGFLLDSIIWVNEDRIRNHRTYQQGSISFDRDYKYSTTNRNAVVSLVNQTGYGESTHSFQQFNLTSQTSLSTTKTVDFDGSFEPKPYQSITLNTATSIRNVIYENQTTGDNIVLTRNWVDGDVSVLDALTPDVKTNGKDQDPGNYNLPTSLLGRNTWGISFEQSNNEDLNYLNRDSKERPVGGANFLSQSFTPAVTGTLTTVGMRYIRQITSTGIGTPVDNLGLYIMSDSAGSPGSILATSTNFSLNTYANNVAEIMESNIALAVTASTKYWIVIGVYERFYDTFSYIKFLGSETSFVSGGEAKYSTGLPSEDVTATSWFTYLDLADNAFRAVIEPTPSINYDWNLTYKKLYG